MKFKKIEIEGIGGITDLTVNFDERMNFICGPNGIGKTTLLECVAHSLSSQHTKILRRNVAASQGRFRALLDVDGVEKQSDIQIQDFTPDKDARIKGLNQYASKILSLKVTRTFQYKPLHAVGKDADKQNHHIYEEAKHGVNIGEVKNWFVNRYLYSAHKGALTKQQINNLELAKQSFSLLNENFTFSRVMASSNEIMIDTPNGEIYYEYLSSGFKSCLSIIFGIIKDIELRFKEPCINADDFDGVILIDELELHLHPEWQSKIAKILLQVFPNAQFITSTHSPHILQSAKPEQIIALAFDNEKVIQRSLDETKYGYQGWTVEEILVDVMGMVDTRTNAYYEQLKLFELSLDAEDVKGAKAAFCELEQLLHPDNNLRKLLRLELATLGGLDD
ncbi:AAA family ATPase [Vibrio sp. WXL103]|uniref:AAA family ATPase n=1 Tax=Vibrio sp. WXL103 TaxID=3450710 RepID=UPI003EC6E273